MDKGKDKWAKVISFLRKSNRDPDKTLKLLKGNQKNAETNYSINRSSYSMNVIAVITQKINEPKNKDKSLTHVIRQWVKTKDFRDFYNLLKGEENLKWNEVEANKTQNKYIKQLNDIWTKPHQLGHKEYFKKTKGKFIINNLNPKK